MKQENFDYLNAQVKNAGFGDNLDAALKENMEKQEPTFQLHHSQQFGKDEVGATLNFRKSDSTENYYFNNYEVAAKFDDTKVPETKQTFYVGKDNNYSLDEAYNLLSNRFVNKDLVNATGEKYNAWVKLDFKDTDANGNFKVKPYGEKWGFDLDKALEKYPQIKELANETDKAKLTDSLKKGNQAEVTLVQDGTEKKGFVVANAYARSVNVTDEDGQRVRMVAHKEQSEDQGKKNEVKNNATEKNTVVEDSKKNKRQGHRV